MIPKQRNHPTIVNKLIGKSSLKSKQVDEDLTQTCYINQAKLPLFSAPEKHTTAPPISAPEKTAPAIPIFCSRNKNGQPLHCSGQQEKPYPGCSFVFYHKTYSPNGLKRKKRNWAAKIFWAGPTLQSPPLAQHKGRLHSNISVRVHAG